MERQQEIFIFYLTVFVPPIVLVMMMAVLGYYSASFSWGIVIGSVINFYIRYRDLKKALER